MRTLKILSILSIAGIIVLAFFSWFSCDDYCNRIQLNGNSVSKIACFQYMNWDGRSLSIAGFVQLFALKYLPVEIITSIWAISFVFSAVLVFKIIRLENPFFFRDTHPLIGVAILCATMWLGMWKFIPDIIYWATGGSYSLLNLLGMLWLFIFLSGLKSKHLTAGSNIFIFFISFICGVNSHNFVVALIVLCILEFIQFCFVMNDKRVSVYIGFSFAGLVIAACVVLFSPGNFFRLHAGGFQGITGKFLFNYILVFAKYIYWLIELFILCLLLLWFGGKNVFEKLNIKNRLNVLWSSLSAKQTTFEFIYRHRYLVAALSTILVFSASSYFAVPRTAIFFATFIVIYFFQHGWKVEWRLKSKRFVAGSSLFLSIFLGIIFFQIIKASALKKKLLDREQSFRQEKGKDVTVLSIPANLVPFAFTFTDVSGDTAYWVNRCVAQYYELKTIKSVSN